MIVCKVFYSDLYVLEPNFPLGPVHGGNGICGVFLLFSQETQRQNIARIVILCYVIINN